MQGSGAVPPAWKGTVWGDYVGVWEEEMWARTRKGGKSEGGNACCFSQET